MQVPEGFFYIDKRYGMAIQSFKCKDTESLFKVNRISRFVWEEAGPKDVEIVDYH